MLPTELPPSPVESLRRPPVASWRLIAGTVALALGYALLAWFGLRWGLAKGAASPIWPAAGFALAALVLGGPRLWPGVLLGYLLAAALNQSPQPVWAILAIGIGNTAMAVAGERLLSSLHFHASMEAFRDYLAFVAAAALTSLIAATVGVAVLSQSMSLGAPAAWNMWTHWYLGDATGMMVVASLILAWSHGRLPRSPGWWTQLAGCLLLTALVGDFVFMQGEERMYSFIAFCPLIWAALALRLRGATLACLTMAAFAVAGTSLGLGPFARVSMQLRYVDLQLFLIVMSAATLVLAVVADERRAQKALMLSEARLRLALEASDTGLWKVHLATGAMSFSPECGRITGLGPGDVEPSRAGIALLLHPDDLPAVRTAFRSAVSSRTLFESEFRLQRPQGGELWLQARGRAMYGLDGQPTAMLGTITDVTARRHDERRLAEQARLLDLTSDAIIVRGLDGRVTFWNDACISVYGYTREEAMGQVARELLHTKFPEPYSRIEQRLLENERWDGELVHRRKDGSTLYVHARWVLTRNPEGQPVSVMQTHTDVTAHRHAEAAARFLAELDRQTAQAGSVDEVAGCGLRLLGEHLGLLRCTLSDIDLDHGRIRTLHEWTDGAPRVTGTFEAREFFTSGLGMALAAGEAVAVSDLRTDPLTAPFAANYLPYGTAALAAASYVIEGRLAGTLTAASGHVRTWRPDELQLLREVVARLWPAIERAKSVAALRESEARFRQMADTAPMMIWVTEPDGLCSYVSRRWTEFTGRMLEAELGLGWLDVVHPEDRPAATAVFTMAMERHEAFASEYRALRWDGHYRWLHASARPRFGAGSEFLGYIGAVMDVTERRAAEEALREADRRKDEFLATLAHELRNPLSPVRTGLQVLNLTDDPEIARRTRQMMERQLGHMVRLIDDLLDVSRITSGKVALQRDRILLQDAARAAVESARPLIEAAGHRLSVDLPEAPLWVDADPTRVAQVVGNLLTNAAKYTPDGGDIVLRVGAGEGTACVEVIDSGLGIPPESLDDVFGMFAQVNRTLDRSQGGLGIGLALSRRLVEMHGGTLVAHSEGLGQGSTFTACLPLAMDTPDADDEEARPAPAPAPGLRVLVVDDNADAAESLAMMLELEGHATRVAFSGAEALQAVEAFAPDLAFLDIGMPGMTGYELARRLRETLVDHAPRLIALSGWGGEGDKRQAAEAGFDLHLTKPVSVENVLQAVAGCSRGEPTDVAG